MDAFAQWADAQARAIVAWSNPSLDYDKRANVGWALTRLDHALVLLALYLLLIVYGKFKQSQEAAAKKRKAAATGDAAAVQKPSTAAAGGDADGEGSAGGRRGPGTSYAEFFASPSKYIGPVLADPVKRWQMLYNIVQVGLSGYMGGAAIYYARSAGYGLICNEFNPAEANITYVQWLFYVSKYVDFLDTVFMVLRSKWGQMSFLHTYHHASIAATYWWVANTAYTGDVWAPIMANAVIHTVMYFYYLSSTFGITPSWGQRLTEMQMLQFVFMLVHGGYMLAFDCPYPRRVTAVYVGYIAFMLLLFAQFYVYKHCCGKRKPVPGKAAPASASAAVEGEGKKSR